MSAEQRKARIEVSVLDGWNPKPGVDIVVEQAWLPMVIFDGVKVVTKSDQSISMMERFVLEALLRLQTLEVRELQEIASIPPELGAWLLASLRQKGLVRNVGDGFAPVVECCTTALASGQLPIKRTDKRDLLWFPETDEVVVLKSSTATIRSLRKLKPSGSWSIPPNKRGKTRAALLDEPLKAGRIHGHNADSILGIPDETPVTDEKIPAYVCSAATSSRVEAGPWHIEVLGLKRERRDADQQPERVSVTLPVPRLPILIDSWRRRTIETRAAVADDFKRIQGVSAQPHGEFGLRVDLGVSEAQVFARERLLAEVFGVTVRIDDEFAFVVPLRCNPADEGATQLFAVDSVIRGLLSDTCTDPTSYGVRRESILNRLWQLRMFKPLYDLREAEDFAA
jgi:hypothetical protein